MENNNQMATQETIQTPNIEAIGVEVSIPITSEDVIPLNCEQSLARFSEEERQEILDLADSIDVRKSKNIKSYGSIAMKQTFDQCGSFLKDERGSHADQEVISRVIELSKKASKSHDDFNMVLQEPGLLRKFLLKLTSGSKGSSQTEKVQKSAITSYDLLVELKKSSELWLEMLEDAQEDIRSSAISDLDNVTLVEKYIIAGKIADERIVGEMHAIKEEYEQTGMLKYANDYKELQSGYENFTITMNNLEQSRIMYYLSLSQLALMKKSNDNSQTAIETQVNNSTALIGQMMRNALLNAKIKEVLEGRTAVIRLNDELIQDVSQAVGMTAEQAEKAMYAGIYDTDAAKTAVASIINSCENIKKTAGEMLPKMKENLTELNRLVEQLEPVVGRTIETDNKTLNIETGNTPNGDAGLQF